MKFPILNILSLGVFFLTSKGVLGATSSHDLVFLEACTSGDAEGVRALLSDYKEVFDKPGDSAPKRQKVEVNLDPTKAMSAISEAARNGHLEVIRVCLNDGRFDLREEGKALLVKAVIAGDVGLVQLLFERGQVEMSNEHAAFMKALASRNNDDVSRILLLNDEFEVPDDMDEIRKALAQEPSAQGPGGVYGSLVYYQRPRELLRHAIEDGATIYLANLLQNADDALEIRDALMEECFAGRYLEGIRAVIEFSSPEFLAFFFERTCKYQFVEGTRLLVESGKFSINGEVYKEAIMNAMDLGLGPGATAMLEYLLTLPSLLDIDIGGPDDLQTYNNLLESACFYGMNSIVKLLLDWNRLPAQLALSSSALGGHTETLKLVLDSPQLIPSCFSTEMLNGVIRDSEHNIDIVMTLWNDKRMQTIFYFALANHFIETKGNIDSIKDQFHEIIDNVPELKHSSLWTTTDKIEAAEILLKKLISLPSPFQTLHHLISMVRKGNLPFKFVEDQLKTSIFSSFYMISYPKLRIWSQNMLNVLVLSPVIDEHSIQDVEWKILLHILVSF